MQSFNFYSFAKKTNSTKLPTLETAKLITGTLKDPCSVLTPTLQIRQFPNNETPFKYTYAKWVGEDRYYFVEEWSWQDGLWEVRMSEDVLATFKTQIGSQSEYVLRTDSTSDYNGEITDTTYPATTDVVTESYVSTMNVFTTDLTVGCYIVGVISGDSSSAVGAITYYAMSSGEFGTLKSMLLSDDNLITMGLAIIDPTTQQLTPTITDVSLEVLKTMYNPYQYIVSCMWFPFGKSAIPTTSPQTSIKIGWWDYPNISGDRLYAQTLELGNEQFAITAHPQSSRGSYLNYAPYTRRYLLGRFGTVSIDTTMYKVGDKINISYVIDLITGQCYTKISRRDETPSTPAEDLIAERNFLVGVPIQLAQVGVDYLGTAISAVNTVSAGLGGAFTGFVTGGVTGAVMGAISSSANGIYNTLQSAMPQVETGGQNGCFLAPSNETHMIEQYYKIVDEDISHRGRPLCEIRTLNTLTGFIMCAEGDVDISCYDNERKAITRFLTEGFFWE